MRSLTDWRSRKVSGRRSIAVAGARWFIRTRIGRFFAKPWFETRGFAALLTMRTSSLVAFA
jgi:hypothetical protein